MHPFKIQLQIQGVDIGNKFDELSEDALTSNEVYEQFVNWMLISYRSVKGKKQRKAVERQLRSQLSGKHHQTSL